MKNRKKIRLIRRFFLVVMVLCLIPAGREVYSSIKHKKQRDALREKVEQSENLEISGGQTVDGIQASGRAAAGNGTGGTEAADGIQTAGGAGNVTDGAEPEIGGGSQSGNGAGEYGGEPGGTGGEGNRRAAPG